VHTLWTAVKIHNRKQRDIDAQIEREPHDCERRCRADPSLADLQGYHAALGSTSTPQEEVGAFKRDDPATNVSPSILS
jgi:hypothetical protein